jgi:hypothetical protein
VCSRRNRRRSDGLEIVPQDVARKTVASTLEARRGESHMDRELYTSTISSVVDYFEGYETLALILNVNVEELRRWADGKSRPPSDVFLRIVDLARRPPGTTKHLN